MIKSMTGFGKATIDGSHQKVRVEIKSVNSKQFDLNIRIPANYKELETNIRNLIYKKLIRGKIDLFVSIENLSGKQNYKINQDVIHNYYNELKKLDKEISQLAHSDILPVLLRMPDVVCAENEETDEQEKDEIIQGATEAANHLDDFRISEGKKMEEIFRQNMKQMFSLLHEIPAHEEKRIQRIRERIKNHFREYTGEYPADESRFEQELLYYIEKIDIAEEKVRLGKHGEYFMETLESNEINGKKLNFISQEMGREINTLGAKAYDVNIQRIVVQMKDVLEQIREQLANIL